MRTGVGKEVSAPLLLFKACGGCGRFAECGNRESVGVSYRLERCASMGGPAAAATHAAAVIPLHGLLQQPCVSVFHGFSAFLCSTNNGCRHTSVCVCAWRLLQAVCLADALQ
jgi:hypothetical protein